MRNIIAIALGLLLGTSACNKPKEEDCRRAIENIRKLSGTDKIIGGGNLDGWVRRCRGNSKRETVQCAIAAQTLDQLKACNIPVEVAPSVFEGSGSASGRGGSGSGSGTGTGTGSTGASGSGTNAGASSASGSGSGSGTGIIAGGSGTGSGNGTGSGSGNGTGSGTASGSAK